MLLLLDSLLQEIELYQHEDPSFVAGPRSNCCRSLPKLALGTGTEKTEDKFHYWRTAQWGWETDDEPTESSTAERGKAEDESTRRNGTGQDSTRRYGTGQDSTR